MRQDGDLAEGAAADVQAPDGLGDRARLGPRIGCHQDAHRRTATRSTRGDELGLVREVGIPADEVGRAVEDALVRAAVMG